jgi:Tfp pilus assembly protein PilF
MWIRCSSALVLLVVLTCLLVRTAKAQLTEADVYVGQAIVDFDDKRYDSALDNLRKALEVEPGHVQALSSRSDRSSAVRQVAPSLFPTASPCAQ